MGATGVIFHIDCRKGVGTDVRWGNKLTLELGTNTRTDHYKAH